METQSLWSRLYLNSGRGIVQSIDSCLTNFGTTWLHALAGLLCLGLVSHPVWATKPKIQKSAPAVKPAPVSPFKMDLLQEAVTYNKEEKNYFRNELTPSYAFNPHFSLVGYFAVHSQYNSKSSVNRFLIEDSELTLMAKLSPIALTQQTTLDLSMGAGGVMPTHTHAQRQSENGGFQINQISGIDAPRAIIKLSHYYYYFSYRYIDYFPEGIDETDPKNLVANSDYYVQNRLDLNFPIGTRRLQWKNRFRNDYTHQIYGPATRSFSALTRIGYQVTKYVWFNAGVVAAKPHNEAGSLVDAKRLGLLFNLYWSI